MGPCETHYIISEALCKEGKCPTILTVKIPVAYAIISTSFCKVFKNQNRRAILSTETNTTPTNVQFHFDPLCPLAWRTALWIREARKVRPLEITWRFFSLEVINRKEGATPDFQTDASWPALRTLALARRKGGNQAVEQLYVALGNARHGQKEDIRESAVIQAALKKAELDPAWAVEALADASTAEEVLSDHLEAVQRYQAFGVPTIALDGSQTGFYGPIIREVPRGEEAGEWWDHLEWLLRQPNLYELKRERGGVSWGPVEG
jgi:predicted DsbA family dithiol-disulfide isomerase